MNKSVIIISAIIICAGLGIWLSSHTSDHTSHDTTITAPLAKGSMPSSIEQAETQVQSISSEQPHAVHSVALPTSEPKKNQPDPKDTVRNTPPPANPVRTVEKPVQPTADSQEEPLTTEDPYQSIEAFEARAKATIPLLSIMAHRPPAVRVGKAVTSSSNVPGQEQHTHEQKQLTSDKERKQPSADKKQDHSTPNQNPEQPTSDQKQKQPPADQKQEQPPADQEQQPSDQEQQANKGNVPQEGEIWIRILPEFSAQSKKIMADTANLFRADTGYTETISVVLWVGGRPWARQEYPAP